MRYYVDDDEDTDDDEHFFSHNFHVCMQQKNRQSIAKKKGEQNRFDIRQSILCSICFLSRNLFITLN